MFTRDVSARGMDYPGVTTVIQVGAPSNREQYVHRLGRTARAGKGGKGFLLLADFESQFLNMLQTEPIEEIPAASSPDKSVINRKILAGIKKEDAVGAYKTWLGYYGGQGKHLKLS